MQTGQRPEAIDTRRVFRVYAVLACVAGFSLLMWGPMWLGSHLAEQQWGKAALIRVLGSFILAAGFCAAGFAAVDPPSARRQGLFWFAAGHAVICLILVTQQIAIWESPVADRLISAMWGVTILLFYLWGTSEGEYSRATLTSLFSGATQESPERLRSQYEQQIRAAARQEGRNRLARDLHDSIKQQIFVVQTAAATVQARLDTDLPGARDAVQCVRDASREAMVEMEAMLDQLRAVPLGNAGLIESLKRQCEALEARTGARVGFRPGSLPPTETFPPGAHEALLRVAQEALANAGRHGRASSVVVSLSALRGQVELRVQDDGAGFDTNDSPRGQGIGNMHARAQELGGTFDLLSRPGNGTTVTFTVPYAAGETAAEYRRRAIACGLLLLATVPAVVWAQSLGTTAVALMAVIGVARYVRAYRRAKELAA